MSEYFKIDGYWKDDKSEFSGYIVKETCDEEEDEGLDDLIFFYGLSEQAIQNSIKLGEEDGGEDFVITSYEKIKFP